MAGHLPDTFVRLPPLIAVLLPFRDFLPFAILLCVSPSLIVLGFFR
ncbi:Uncharacterized protein YR821_0675 [Yersinia ruckeri]|uniref:Uncharacterized protein n=1 Tax=Yersinia ruckeri TaxID=29486 RepID=A0A0A8VDQ2_YERRU|nr:hypothetical protein yruck0001_24530 [Yersinia ruckeri ATCC 29473]QTD75607.1 Uncharacterized protein YR821_0675 [Yersinia ruckeri]CEK26503.1 hypothetical protein CSF007_3620 [Yersinia ruckeri]